MYLTDLNGSDYVQLKDCMMETSCWQDGGPTSNVDPITATRVQVWIEKKPIITSIT